MKTFELIWEINVTEKNEKYYKPFFEGCLDEIVNFLKKQNANVTVEYVRREKCIHMGLHNMADEYTVDKLNKLCEGIFEYYAKKHKLKKYKKGYYILPSPKFLVSLPKIEAFDGEVGINELIQAREAIDYESMIVDLVREAYKRFGISEEG